MQSPWLRQLKRGAGWLTEGGGLRPKGLGPWSRPLTLLPGYTPGPWKAERLKVFTLFRVKNILAPAEKQT